MIGTVVSRGLLHGLGILNAWSAIDSLYDGHYALAAWNGFVMLMLARQNW